MISKVWSTHASAVIGVVLFGLMSADNATCQEVLGKTLRGKYSTRSCNTINGFCAPVRPINFNVYVSPQGHVYDYASDGTAEKGDVYTLGVTAHGKFSDTTWIADGNRLTLKLSDSQSVVYTLRGNSCEISNPVSLRNLRVRMLTQSCSVVDGNPN
jgi:hypothetical protein